MILGMLGVSMVLNAYLLARVSVLKRRRCECLQGNWDSLGPGHPWAGYEKRDPEVELKELRK